MTFKHCSSSEPGLDRLVDVWLQMHDVLLLRQLLRDFGKGLQEMADRPLLF